MSYELKCTLVIFIFGFCCNYFASAAAYPWQADHEGYDASLDPVIWSRAFVKDNIRRPRQHATFPAAAGENNEVQLNNRFYEFQQRFVDSNRAVSDILRDEKRRVESSAHIGERRTGALTAENQWNTIAHAKYRSRNNRKSSLNRSKAQARRKRNHKR